MDALNVAVFLWVLFAKSEAEEIVTSLEIRSDVACPEGWSYAFESKCVQFYPASDLQQATITCQKSASDLGIPVDTMHTVVVRSLAVTQALTLEQIWLGHDAGEKDQFEGIPACSEETGQKGECVKLVFTGLGARCWATEACDSLLPFFCIGDATLLRMKSMSAGQGH